MSYWPYLYLFEYGGSQHILHCVFVLFVFVLCTICCRFLWIVYFFIVPSVFSNVYSATNHSVHFWLSLWYSLAFFTFIKLVIKSENCAYCIIVYRLDDLRCECKALDNLVAIFTLTRNRNKQDKCKLYPVLQNFIYVMATLCNYCSSFIDNAVLKLRSTAL